MLKLLSKLVLLKEPPLLLLRSSSLTSLVPTKTRKSPTLERWSPTDCLTQSRTSPTTTWPLLWVLTTCLNLDQSLITSLSLRSQSTTWSSRLPHSPVLESPRPTPHGWVMSSASSATWTWAWLCRLTSDWWPPSSKTLTSRALMRSLLKSRTLLLEHVRTSWSPMSSQVAPSPSLTWACSVYTTSRPSSTHLRLVSWLWVLLRRESLSMRALLKIPPLPTSKYLLLNNMWLIL